VTVCRVRLAAREVDAARVVALMVGDSDLHNDDATDPKKAQGEPPSLPLSLPRLFSSSSTVCKSTASSAVVQSFSRFVNPGGCLRPVFLGGAASIMAASRFASARLNGQPLPGGASAL